MMSVNQIPFLTTLSDGRSLSIVAFLSIPMAKQPETQLDLYSFNVQTTQREIEALGYGDQDMH